MKTFCIFLILLTLGLTLACCVSTNSHPPLDTVSYVDLSQYVGKWYEIARYPHSFEKGCSNVTAVYTPREDGAIAVRNTCTLEADGGKTKEAKGVAKVADSVSNAKLKVSFFRPFYGDYWILKLDPDYRYAVVGAPSRKYLWILGRTPDMPDRLYEELVEEIRSFGYNPEQHIRTRHTRK